MGTLRESVLTDAWIEGILNSHCGAEPVAMRQLFAEPDHPLVRLLSWAPSVATVWFSVTSFMVATGLLVAACRHRRPSSHQDAMPLHIRGAWVTLEDEDVVIE